MNNNENNNNDTSNKEDDNANNENDSDNGVEEHRIIRRRRRRYSSWKVCVACRASRRKCGENCLLAPYFPRGTEKQYSEVKSLFGLANLERMIRDAPPENRQDAVATLCYKAAARDRHPVRGTLGSCGGPTALLAQMAYLHLQTRRLNKIAETFRGTTTTTTTQTLTLADQASSSSSSRVRACMACRCRGSECGPGCAFAAYFFGTGADEEAFGQVNEVFGLETLKWAVEIRVPELRHFLVESMVRMARDFCSLARPENRTAAAVAGKEEVAEEDDSDSGGSDRDGLDGQEVQESEVPEKNGLDDHDDDHMDND